MISVPGPHDIHRLSDEEYWDSQGFVRDTSFNSHQADLLSHDGNTVKTRVIFQKTIPKTHQQYILYSYIEAQGELMSICVCALNLRTQLFYLSFSSLGALSQLSEHNSTDRRCFVMFDCFSTLTTWRARL